MMRDFGLLFFLVTLFIFGDGFVLFGYSTTSNPGAVSTKHGSYVARIARSWKRENNAINPPKMFQQEDAGNIHLEDYRPINPVPSSKASIRPKPTQHGTPLMPYIPQPSPPPPGELN